MSGLKGISHVEMAAEYERRIAGTEVAAHVDTGALGWPVNLVSQLRVAAIATTAEFMFGKPISNALERSVDDAIDPAAEAVALANVWAAYLRASDQADESPSLDDLATAAAILVSVGHPIEIRGLLHRPSVAKRLATPSSKSRWTSKVREEVSRAAALLVAQSPSELEHAGQIVRALSGAEQSKAVSGGDALFLLGTLHLGLAVEQTASYLLTGDAQAEGQSQGFSAQLRRLLMKAEEYLDLYGDPEARLWAATIAILVVDVYRSSLRASAYGIDAQIDALLDVVSSLSRDSAIFSLLPSQLEALRLRLLDPAPSAVVLEMPTSGGKTLLAEFAAVQSLRAYRGHGARVLYLCPTRALVTQVARTLTADLSELGIQVAVAASAFEEDPIELELLAEAEGIVVSTPEKADLLLRTQLDWFQAVRLVIVDEAHLLKERNSERGVRLELLLANLRREAPGARLMLLTPFVDNAAEIAKWLGGDRSSSIKVSWRPSNILLGLTKVLRRGQAPMLSIDWTAVGRKGTAADPDPLVLASVGRPLGASTLDVAVELMERFQALGTVLAVFTASKAHPEIAALRVARSRSVVSSPSPELRVAIALSRADYGDANDLVYCLERGVAFHHAALSPTLRYLVEDRVRAGEIRAVAATTTLAQGMNFPVSTVIMHSLHKPYGKGNLSPAEFWNIAGRAGRVGLSDTGLVLFANEEHEKELEHYSKTRNEEIRSALLGQLEVALRAPDLKSAYREIPALRPFLQYLLHAVARMGPEAAVARIEELIEGSLASVQVGSREEGLQLRALALRYMRSLTSNQGINRSADASGLGSFSFSELFAKTGSDSVLRTGPDAILARRDEGLTHLIEALRWLPELELAIGYGKGAMNVTVVAQTVQDWMDGRTVFDIARRFPGETEQERVRRAGSYLYDKVSQTVSWGAHAYLKGWQLRRAGPPQDSLLPSYIEFGVHSEEAVIASLFGIPRPVAEGFAAEFRDRHASLASDKPSAMETFLMGSDEHVWQSAVDRTELRELDSSDLRHVWRSIRGMAS